MTSVSEKAKEARILVATPNFQNQYSAEVYVNHMELIRKWQEWGIYFKWMVIGRTFVHFARSQACEVLVQSFDKGIPFSHILWLDDDAMVDPEIIPRFIDHDKDVMIAPYPMRRFPHQIGVLSATSYICECGKRTQIAQDVTPMPTVECECGKEAKRDFHDHRSYRNLNSKDMDQGLVDIDGGGTHAMLVKAECFFKHGTDEKNHLPADLKALIDRLSPEDKKILDHYVGEIPDESGSFATEAEMGKPYFMMPKSGTEDMWWCYRAKKKGIEIWTDTDVFANHLGFPPVINFGHVGWGEKASEEAKAAGSALEVSGGIAKLRVDDEDLDPSVRRNAVSTKNTGSLV